MKRYVWTFVSLMVLLVATWRIAYIDLGRWNTPISLLIATGKALLVAVFFMELRSSKGLDRVFAMIGVFWLSILISFTLSDVLSRGWLEMPGHWPLN